MKTVQMDPTGKIYVPKEVQPALRGRKYFFVVLPNGDARLCKVPKKLPVEEAIRKATGLFKTTKSIKRLRKEAREQAARDALRQ